MRATDSRRAAARLSDPSPATCRLRALAIRAAWPLVLVAGMLLAPPAAARQRLPIFRPEWLEPYLSRGRGGEARQLLLAGMPEKAVNPLRRHLRQGKPAAAQQARYLLAQALLASSSDAAVAEAAKLFAELIESYPLLRDYHRYHAAQALFRGRQFDRAEVMAASVEAGAVLKTEAELVRAEALYARQRLPEAAQIYREYLKRNPGGGQVGRAHFRIGEALEGEAAAKGSDPRRAAALGSEALQAYQRVLIKTPLHRLRGEAEKRVTLLARRLPDGAKLARLTPWQRFEQAQGYFRAMRNKQSEAAFAALLPEKEEGALFRCKVAFYLAKSVFKQRQRARSVPLYQQAARACREAGEQELVVKSLYDLGRGLMNARQHANAVKQFVALEKEFSRHSYADDALLWAAEAAEAGGDPKEAERLLASLPERHPGGDMVHEALWRLARGAYVQRQHDVALKHLDQALSQVPRPRYYYAQGQALYWKARILDQRQGRREAATLYERCIREYPLSYYALMAFNRLRERHGPLYRKLYGELIAAAGQGRGSWSFPDRELFGHPAFLRGIELSRLGFGADAAREFARAGLRLKRRAADGEEELWLAAVLFDRAGLWHLSHQVPRSMDTSYKRGYPLRAEYRRWAISFPRAFPTLVRLNAGKAGIAEELVLAIMREESGFTTTIESYANAIGLMQLILPTARTAGREHRMAITRELLQDPALNIKLGATYLGFLQRAFVGVIPLAIAGYNAGEGAAYRWLRQMGSVGLDEFLERIPYDQTRRYTKRVLATLFTYSVLYGRGAARVPRLGQTLPAPSAVSFGRPSGK